MTDPKSPSALSPLLSQLAVLSVRVEDSLCCSRELNLDLLQREKDMAMRCEPERSGLEGLKEQQDTLEVRGARGTARPPRGEWGARGTARQPRGEGGLEGLEEQ